MAIFYPFSDQLPVWQVLGATLLIIVISVTVIVMAKRLPYLFVGWLWYAITILPVIGIIQVSLATPYSMADRYHYLPSIGIAVILAWGIPFLIKREDTRKKILLPVSIAALSIMAVFTWQQCGYWKNSIELFNHALQVTKNNFVAVENLTTALIDKGRSEEAIEHCNRAIRMNPGEATYYNARGTAYVALGQHQLAIEDFNNAISLDPNYFKAYNNRGLVYAMLGQYQPAIKDFNKAIGLNQDYFKAYNNRGFVYTRLDQYQPAMEDFNKAIDLKKDYTDAYFNRALVYFNQKNIFPGCSNAQKACELGNCKILEAVKAKGYCR
jgi:tetratricopeptide (TPR) repeat protein